MKMKKWYLALGLPIVVSGAYAEGQQPENVSQFSDAIYNSKFDTHYQQHNIVNVLGLDENKFSESIENIKQLGRSSIKDYVDRKSPKVHVINKRDYYVPGGPSGRVVAKVMNELNGDVLITTGRGQNEDIFDYFRRLDVSNFNYVILENYMQMLLESKEHKNAKDLLETLVTKLSQRAYINERWGLDKILEKIERSHRDVERYIEAGALDEFLETNKDECAPAPLCTKIELDVKRPVDKSYLDEHNLANEMLNQSSQSKKKNKNEECAPVINYMNAKSSDEHIFDKPTKERKSIVDNDPVRKATKKATKEYKRLIKNASELEWSKNATYYKGEPANSICLDGVVDMLNNMLNSHRQLNIWVGNLMTEIETMPLNRIKI